jgi:hypothetical protein
MRGTGRIVWQSEIAADKAGIVLCLAAAGWSADPV